MLTAAPRVRDARPAERRRVWPSLAELQLQTQDGWSRVLLQAAHPSHCGPHGRQQRQAKHVARAKHSHKTARLSSFTRWRAAEFTPTQQGGRRTTERAYGHLITIVSLCQLIAVSYKCTAGGGRGRGGACMPRCPRAARTLHVDVGRGDVRFEARRGPDALAPRTSIGSKYGTWCRPSIGVKHSLLARGPQSSPVRFEASPGLRAASSMRTRAESARLSSHVSTLPAAFPLLAALSLLRDVLVALLRLFVHGLALLPRVAAAWCRRAWTPAAAVAAAAASASAGVEFYEGTVTHTRHSPVFHNFTYAVSAHTRSPLQVRNVLVDLDAPPRWLAQQQARCTCCAPPPRLPHPPRSPTTSRGTKPDAWPAPGAACACSPSRPPPATSRRR